MTEHNKHQHTPGPWATFNGVQVAPANGLPGDKALAVCYDSEREGRGWEENQANARLMAAAPELLEAAKMAQETIGWVADASKTRDVKDALRKAIEKAERHDA